MTDRQRDNPIRDELAAALRTRGIAGPEQFRERYGIAPATLTSPAALVLVITPAWVLDIWIPSTDPTPCLYVPQAARSFAAVYGIRQEEAECDDDFNARLKAAIRKLIERAAA